MRLGQRRWKAVHYCAYAAWPIAVFHAAGTGSDTRLATQLALYAVSIAAVIAALWWRLHRPRRARAATRAAAALLSLAAALAFYAFVVSGPLAPGWSHRAQEPSTVPIAGATR